MLDLDAKTDAKPTNNNGRRNSTGKRFVRRARRWAELQQRRQNKKLMDEKNDAMSWRPPSRPNVFDYVEKTIDGTEKKKLAFQMSLPCSYVPKISLSPVCYNDRDFGTFDFYAGGLHRKLSSKSSATSSSSSLPSSPEYSYPTTDDLLDIVTNDLSVANLDTFFPNESKGVRANFGVPFYTVQTEPPSERSWVMIRHADPERPIATFTVLCYNVLCDKYATVNQYSYCPSWALNWEYRKSMILKEIRTYEADIVTLQEVETEQFRSLFQPELKKLGYVGIFTPKSRAKTMSEEERKYVDGCAIFWKTEKFDLDRQHAIEFTSLAMKKASTSENFLNRVMPRDNIALCAVLKVKESVYANLPGRVNIPMNDNVVGNPLVVCTAHIHWDPEFCDVKLVQTMMLAHEVSRLLDDVAKNFGLTTQQCPVLICGDLNSLPESGVFEFLSRGQISRRHSDFKKFRDDACLDKFTNSTDKNMVTHPLRLDSAVDPSSIPFTNYTLDFKGMIDYIFSTPQSLARLGVLGSFDQNWVVNNKIIGFPHPHVPSDHIPIMAQYAIIPRAHQRQPPPPPSQGSGGGSSGTIGSGYQHQQSYLRL